MSHGRFCSSFPGIIKTTKFGTCPFLTLLGNDSPFAPLISKLLFQSSQNKHGDPDRIGEFRAETTRQTVWYFRYCGEWNSKNTQSSFFETT